MPIRLSTWLGTSVVSALGVYLAWKQVADIMPRWSIWVVLSVLAVGSVLALPVGTKEDGSARRLIDGRSAGRKSAALTSGHHSRIRGNIQNTGQGSVTVNNGLSTDQIVQLREHLDNQVADEVQRYVDLRMEAFKQDVVKFTGEANQQALELGKALITDFVEQLATKSPNNINSLKTASMQHAILTAQTSAAISDDVELSATLVDILIDKSGTEPRSFKGVVLTEALQVAGKLTIDQINLLTALVILKNTVTYSLVTLDLLLEYLDAKCRPLFNKIPTSSSALRYMTYTGVGDIEQTTAMFTGRASIADDLANTYDSVITYGFAIEDLPDALRQFDDYMTSVDQRMGTADKYRFKIASSQTIERLALDNVLKEPFLSHHREMKELIVKSRLPGSKLLEIAAHEKPDLTTFLQGLDSISASMFTLSSVGIAVGQANWRRLHPDDAPDVDMYLR